MCDSLAHHARASVFWKKKNARALVLTSSLTPSLCTLAARLPLHFSSSSASPFPTANRSSEQSCRDVGTVCVSVRRKGMGEAHLLHQSVLGTVGSLLIELREPGRRGGADEDGEDKMRRIRAVLHDAEEHWNTREESSKLKLQELKDVAYDMEDVVDEYEYEVNRCKVEALERHATLEGNTRNKRKRQEQNEVYTEDMGAVPVPNELIHRARKITARFNEIVDFSDRFTLSENDGERRISHGINDSRQTGSFVFEKSIHGRDEDKDRIVEKLFSDEGKNVGSPVSVMAIVGMGGLGKTTVAKLVYNSPRVRRSFDMHAWVCVSEPFSVSAVTRKIISSLLPGTCECTELADFQGKLAAKITDKKVLLVLDDVWNERRDCWDLLCTTMSAARFCQIIVTTRSETVVKLVQTMPMYCLNCLTSDESWSLFKHVAFANNQESNTLENLKEIGKKIVKKCKGLPLAIKTVGSMLRYEKDEKIWEDVLENELFDLEQTRNEVLPVLELCYKHMPIYLKRCFIALSLYPKDTLLTKKETIGLWKLLDLLNFNGSECEEEVGNFYLKELLQRSILQTYGIRYWMHDLVHDLACFLSAGEFHRLENDTLLEVPQNVRYISLPFSDKSVEIPPLPPSLRVFVMLDSFVEIINPKSLFLSGKNLRALVLRNGSLLEALPNFIVDLKLVRHLIFEFEDDDLGENLTSSISMFQLYNLQRLEHGTSECKLLVIHDIARLINLRTLDILLSRCGCSCNIKELRRIKKIRELSITGLGCVSCIEDANEARMQSKTQLQSLMLDFGVEDKTCCQHILQPEPASTLSHDQILGSLQPHCSLTELTIKEYESHRYPNWLGNDYLSKLTRITLFCCGSKQLPQLGGLPSLRFLNVEIMENVESIGPEFIGRRLSSKGFPSLTEMVLSGIYNWLERSGVDDGDFARLQDLSITDCPKLKSLPMVPFLALKSVYIEECGVATVPKWSTLCKLHIGRCDSLSEVPTLPSLLELYLAWCPKLRAVGSQPSLTSMRLNRINPSSVGFDSLSSLTSLRRLRLHKCRNLYYFDGLASLTSLQHLEVRGCPELHYCDGLAGLTSLQHLEVRGCPRVLINDLDHLRQRECRTIIEDE